MGLTLHQEAEFAWEKQGMNTLSSQQGALNANCLAHAEPEQTLAGGAEWKYFLT